MHTYMSFELSLAATNYIYGPPSNGIHWHCGKVVPGHGAVCHHASAARKLNCQTHFSSCNTCKINIEIIVIREILFYLE